MRSIEEILRNKNFRFANLKELDIMARKQAMGIPASEPKKEKGNRILYNQVKREDFIMPLEEGPRFGGDFYYAPDDIRLNFAFSVQMGWEHLSVSTPDKTPTWDQMCAMKEAIFEDEEEAVEYHPKKSEYVNFHPHCLHIWRPNLELIIGMYQEQGFVEKGEVFDLKGYYLSKVPEKDRELIERYMKAEGMSTELGDMQLYNRVPGELLGLPKPPSIGVGTKTKEGYEALKDYAHSKGARVNIGDTYFDDKEGANE
jgi:hypothetical protein